MVNRDRVGSTTSSVRTGRWVMSTVGVPFRDDRYMTPRLQAAQAAGGVTAGDYFE